MWLSLTVFKHGRFQPLPELPVVGWPGWPGWLLTTPRARVESVRHWIWGISANRGPQ